ncbi:MAG: hypothetical protein ACREHG_08075, partial [Candidatus Saccharimonadales bacterium]
MPSITWDRSPAPASISSPTPLNSYANPEDEPPVTALQFNKAWSKPGAYVTKLSPQDEQKFQQWVKANKPPWQDTP